MKEKRSIQWIASQRIDELYLGVGAPFSPEKSVLKARKVTERKLKRDEKGSSLDASGWFSCCALQWEK